MFPQGFVTWYASKVIKNILPQLRLTRIITDVNNSIIQDKIVADSAFLNSL